MFPLFIYKGKTNSSLLVSKGVFNLALEDFSQVWARTLVTHYKMINHALGEFYSYEEHISNMQGDINHEIYKLGVLALGENTLVDDLLNPFKDLIKKEVEDPFSFNEDTLDSIFDISVVI